VKLIKTDVNRSVCLVDGFLLKIMHLSPLEWLLPRRYRALEKLFRNGHLILEADQRTPRPIAILRKGLRGYLLTEEIQGAETIYEIARDGRMTGDQVDALADLFAFLHREGIFHHDLKSANILWGSTERFKVPGWFLVDLEKVSYPRRRLMLKKRYLNLAQINASIPGAVSSAMRVRFYLRYMGRNTLTPADKQAIAAVMEISRARKHLWPDNGPLFSVKA